MGSSPQSKSTRVRKARSVEPATQARRKAPAMPVAVESTIEDQRRALITAITLLYCLHTVLRRLTEDSGEEESEAVRDAAGWVELPDVTAMLLKRLHAVHLALDSISLRQSTQASAP